MKLIWCKHCNAACGIRKAPPKRTGDIIECAEIIYHMDGTRERRIYGHVNTTTQAIIDMQVLGG